MNIDFKNIPEADVLINSIQDRLRKGLNSNLFVIGLSGTGKSSTSIRLAELIKDKIEIDSEIFIVDSLLEFIKSLRKSKKGDIIVPEEVSVLFPSRRAMATDNVSMGKIFDTCRKKHLTIISNAPIWGSIDSHMRAMGHFLIETLRINKTQKVVVSKFHRLQTNPSSGKTYRHTMQRDGRDVARMFTRMPSKERWDNYEKQKDKFMDELYEKLESEQLRREEKLQKDSNKKNTSIKDLSPRELQVHQMLFRKGMTQKEVAIKLGLSAPRVNIILKNILRKSQNENSKLSINDKGNAGEDFK